MKNGQYTCTKEGTQMMNLHMTIFATLVVIREMKISMSVFYHHIPLKCL